MCELDDAALVDADQAAREEEIADGVSAFFALVQVAPEDLAVARLAAEAVLQAVADARGPDDPTPGMLSVPHLVADGVARATLADASPGARETLGALEVALVRYSADGRRALAERLERAIRDADRRLEV